METVFIIGAGPAGLTAAYDLKKKMGSGVRIILAEESNTVGGISQTVEYKGNRIDLGGHRFFSKSDEINALWEEILPLQGAPSYDDRTLNREVKLSTNGPDPEKTDEVMLSRRRVSRIFFQKKFFDYPISMKPQTFLNMGMKSTLKAGFGYLFSCVHKLPETSLENFYINRFGRPLYEMFFEDYTEKVWGIHPSEISSEWGAQRVKGLSIRTLLANAITAPFRQKDTGVETSLIESFSYPKLGPGQLWETMSKRFMEMCSQEDKLLMNTKVVGFNQDASGKILSVICQSATGERVSYPCDMVFSSMPVKDLAAALPQFPEEERKIAEKLPYRDFITVGLLVNRLQLQNSTPLKTLGNIVPDCWIYIQDRGVKIGRLQIFNNWSPYMVKDPDHTVWIGLEYFCNENDPLWNMSEKEFIRFASEEVQSLGIISKTEILDSICLHVKKAYPAYFGSYDQFDRVKNELNNIPNLLCIGRNGQHRYNNMDHSMMTGLEASRIFRNHIKEHNSLWNINTEQSYHEEKKSR